MAADKRFRSATVRLLLATGSLPLVIELTTLTTPRRERSTADAHTYSKLEHRRTAKLANDAAALRENAAGALANFVIDDGAASWLAAHIDAVNHIVAELRLQAGTDAQRRALVTAISNCASNAMALSGLIDAGHPFQNMVRELY